MTSPDIATLTLSADPIDLTIAIVDIESVSGNEAALADTVEQALRTQTPHLEVVRSGNAVLARTNLGRPSRVILAGHLDTVPVNDNFPHHITGSGDERVIHGLGTVDMKSGDAVFLNLAATLTDPKFDLTFIFYDLEEVASHLNGLGRVERELPEWLEGEFAIVGEPSGGVIEAGCQGTMRFIVRTKGIRSHTARAWMGKNAIHAMSAAMDRLAAYEPRKVTIDGCHYREGLQAVRISGGVAGNVVPDECELTVNFRFAPDRTGAQAAEHVKEVFAGFDVEVTDLAEGALPGLSSPAAQALLAAAGGKAVAKLGWTDVARFAALRIPAVNFGPGDPLLAHTQQENVPVAQITEVAEVLYKFLSS
jgi:succinyl-diaminopimelate desuccinylase